MILIKIKCPQYKVFLSKYVDLVSILSQIFLCLTAIQAQVPIFRCNNGKVIPDSLTCDGTEDCSGGEDERTRSCPEGECCEN